MTTATTASAAAKPSSVPPEKKPRTARLSLAAWRQFINVAKPYWLEDERKQAWLLLLLLIGLMLVETKFAVMLNEQTGEMTSALAAKDGARFWKTVRACLMVLAFAVPVYAFYYYMRDSFANHWRRWLTGRFLDGYLKGRKYYELGADSEIDNPDQRISEDVNTFTGRSIHFLLIFLGSIMQLVAFSTVLWSISQLLVGVLALYALVGTAVALYVFGTPLIHLNYWQLRREADFRFSLIRLRENAESIAFYRGEAQERSHINHKFDRVIQNFARLIRKQRSLNLFQRSFSQLTLVLPGVILAERVLSGELEVGRAVQAAGAFTAVLAAVAVIVDNFESLSRFVAGIGRLQALSNLVLPGAAEDSAPAASLPRIELRSGQQIALESLTLHPPQSERVLIKELSLSLTPGDALLITGDSGCGKSSLLRAIAGLWQTGSGIIHCPPAEEFFFLPQQPYLQSGTLRSQIIYPAAHSDLSDEQLQEILEQVHLPHLADRMGGLEAVQDWEKLLSVGEQQRLAFARVLVHQPRIVIDMMGLWPLPPRTDLKATVTGTVDGGAFTIEKLHFQSMPGLYVTANLYVPKVKAKHPAILYVCGHGNVVENGISYGSKVSYQYHPAWFASNGYVCLILDTNELAEIRGDHHGTHGRGYWWWHSRGYTPAGVELWNALRAIDYLETRPEVDAKRIGVTGRSGGGATSWWVVAADDRVQAAVPVAGIADLYAHICQAPTDRFKDGVISGHCDCMYMVNTYRWDFATVAALFAPRPLLLGNSDEDGIFPVEGYRRLADKTSKVYALYGAQEKFQLHETKGPHKDTPELHLGINGWMNRWLKDEPKAEVVPSLEKRFKPTQLQVFDKLPEPRRNEAIHDSFVPMAKFDGPVTKESWAKQKPELMEALKTKVFGGWPTDPPPLGVEIAADLTHEGVRVRTIDFTSEAAVDLRMWVLTAAKVEAPAEVVLEVVDSSSWEHWTLILGLVKADAKLHAALAENKRALVVVAPRGVGPTRWAEPGSRDDIHIRRRFPLIGQTVEGQRVWDVRRAVAAVRTVDDLTALPLTLRGKGEPAALALYASLFEPSVASLHLTNLPASHQHGPALLNVMRYLDMPQAVALASPRTITLTVKADADRAAWVFPLAVQSAVGAKGLTVQLASE